MELRAVSPSVCWKDFFRLVLVGAQSLVPLFILLTIGGCAGVAHEARTARPHAYEYPFQYRQVVLQVICDGCFVTFAVGGGRAEEVGVDGIWTHRLQIYQSERGVALTAVPANRVASVLRARITNGEELLAEGDAGPGEPVDLFVELR